MKQEKIVEINRLYLKSEPQKLIYIYIYRMSQFIKCNISNFVLWNHGNIFVFLKVEQNVH